MKWSDVNENDIVKVKLNGIYDTKRSIHNAVEVICLVTKISDSVYNLRDIVFLNTDFDLDYDWAVNIYNDMDNYELLEIVAHYPTPEELLAKIHPEYFI